MINTYTAFIDLSAEDISKILRKHFNLPEGARIEYTSSRDFDNYDRPLSTSSLTGAKLKINLPFGQVESQAERQTNYHSHTESRGPG